MSEEQSDLSEENDVVKIDYIKSNYFRVVHAEGIWGCVTPSLNIQVAFWNERFPIPNHIEYKVQSDGNLEEIKEARKIRDAIVREVEASVLINVETAGMLISWLTERIQEIQELKLKQGSQE